MTSEVSPEQRAALAKEDQGPLTKNIVITFTIIAFISVCLRFYTRLRFLGRSLGWEDHTIAIAMVAAIITAVFQILQVNAGNGKHAIFIPFPEGTEKLLKFLWFSILFYNVSLTTTKVSILLQYLRIFAVRPMRIPIYAILGIVVAYAITTMLTAIFACVPVQAFWKILEQPDAKCIDDKTLWYSNAIVNIITDLTIALLPIRLIWALQIAKRQKIALLCILTIGWFVCVISIIRLHVLVVFFRHQDDTSYYGAPNAYWSAIEMNLAIVCASLPALKPLIVNIIPGFSSSHASGTYGTAPSSRFASNGRSVRRSAQPNFEDDVELSSGACNSTANGSMYGQNLSVSKQFGEHCEEIGRASDSESQHDLVTKPKSVLEKH